MPYYRFYLFDSLGRIGSGTGLDCADDEAAVAHAATRLATHRLLAQVWAGTRCVARGVTHSPNRGNRIRRQDGAEIYSHGAAQP
jgi:hypothetical protein